MKTTCLDGLWQEGRDFLACRFPIMCGAMTWISDSTLVKAVSDQGGFGCLAAGNMPGDLLSAEIDKCVQQSKSPFAVNLVTIAPNFPAHKEAVKASKAPDFQDSADSTIFFQASATSLKTFLDSAAEDGPEAGLKEAQICAMIFA